MEYWLGFHFRYAFPLGLIALGYIRPLVKIRRGLLLCFFAAPSYKHSE
jgi:hypothetical protein